MAESPYINWYTSDFLQGVSACDMTAEQIGVYAIILNLIADAGGPIEDDASWLARRCNISTRRCNLILAELAAMPRKIERKNGVIGNRRMLAEVNKRDKKSQQARGAANEKWNRWRAENKPQLPFGDEGKKTGKKSSKPNNINEGADADAFSPETADKTSGSPIYRTDNPEIKSEISLWINSQKSQNSANSSMRTHPDSCAGVVPEPEYTQTTYQDSTPRESDRLIGPDDDLMKLLERVGSVAGFVPTTAGRITNSIDLIKSWRDAGIDFNATVIPVIERIIAESHEPTGSLSRFDRQIRHEHARANVSASPGTAKPKPLAPPRIDVEGEDPSLTQLRKDLHAALGTQRYVQFVNRIDFEIVATANGSRPIRAVHRPGDPHRLLDNDRISTVKNIAKKNGFSDVWE